MMPDGYIYKFLIPLLRFSSLKAVSVSPMICSTTRKCWINLNEGISFTSELYIKSSIEGMFEGTYDGDVPLTSSPQTSWTIHRGHFDLPPLQPMRRILLITGMLLIPVDIEISFRFTSAQKFVGFASRYSSLVKSSFFFTSCNVYDVTQKLILNFCTAWLLPEPNILNLSSP